MVSVNLFSICPKLLVILNVFFSVVFFFSSGDLETTLKKGLFMHRAIRYESFHIL